MKSKLSACKLFRAGLIAFMLVLMVCASAVLAADDVPNRYGDYAGVLTPDVVVECACEFDHPYKSVSMTAIPGTYQWTRTDAGFQIAITDLAPYVAEYNNQYAELLKFEHAYLTHDSTVTATHQCWGDTSCPSLKLVKQTGYRLETGTKWIETLPTCTEEGVGTYTCVQCGKYYEHLPIPATEHNKKTSTTKTNGLELCTNGYKTYTWCDNPWCDDQEGQGTKETPLVEEHAPKGHYFPFMNHVNVPDANYDGMCYHFGDSHARPCVYCGKWMVNPPHPSIQIGSDCSLCERGSGSGSPPPSDFTWEGKEWIGDPPTWWNPSPNRAPANTPSADDAIEPEENPDVTDDTTEPEENPGVTDDATEPEENPGMTDDAGQPEENPGVTDDAGEPEASALDDEAGPASPTTVAARFISRKMLAAADVSGTPYLARVDTDDEPHDSNIKDKESLDIDQLKHVSTDVRGGISWEFTNQDGETRTTIYVYIKSGKYTVEWRDADTGELIEGKDADERFADWADPNTTIQVSVTDADKAIDVPGYTFVSDDERNVLSADLASDGSTVLVLYFKKPTENPAYTVRWMADGKDLVTPEKRYDVKAGEEASVTDVDKERTFSGYTFNANAQQDWMRVVAEDGSTELILYYGKSNTPGGTPEIPPVIPENPPVNPPAPGEDIPEPDVPLSDIPSEDSPLTDIPEEDPPLTDIPEEDPPLEDIPEEDPPLSGVPETGDISQLWTMLALLTGAGLVWMVLDSKKHRKDA